MKESLKSKDGLTISEIQDFIEKEHRIDIQKEEICQICREYVIKEKVSKKPSLEEDDTYRWLNSKK